MSKFSNCVAVQQSVFTSQAPAPESLKPLPEGAAITAGARVWIDGAGWGTVVVETSNSKVRVTLARNRLEDLPRDKLRVVASDDATPASPANPPSDELAATAPAPTPEDALDAAAAPAPVAQPCADQVDELAALLQSIQVRGGVPPGYESMLAEALRLLRVVDAAGRAGDDAAPLRPVHAAQAALPSLAADLVAPPAARPHAVETPPAPAPMAMDEEPVRTASPEPSEDAAAAASPVAATAVVPRPPASPVEEEAPVDSDDEEFAPQIEAKRREIEVERARAADATGAEGAARAVAAPPARKRRRAPATASPEPAGPDASAPAERPAKRTKRDWTPAEDEKLRAAREKSISVRGEVDWKDVAAEVGTRNNQQCRERWHYQLDPGINKSKFTAEEDAHLLALSKSDLPQGPKGTDWERVAKGLPTVDGRRKGKAVKSRYDTLMRRKR